jgi:3-deoxy-manno-octulosonate cytidylyltransferase (CMP-KDO synthetase)
MLISLNKQRKRMKKNIIIIPARYNSKRFPGKPLALLAGKPMIHFLYDRIKDYPFFHVIIVATDDDNILKYCIENDIPCTLTSVSHQSGTDRVAEVASKFPGDYNIFNIQGDEPFIKASDILKLMETLAISPDGIATLACVIKNASQRKNPNRVKVVFNNQMEAMYFSRYDIPYQKDESALEFTHQHIGVYAFINEKLQILSGLSAGRYERAESLEQLRWLEAGYKIKLGIVEDSLFSVDTPDDLLEANKQIK